MMKLVFLFLFNWLFMLDVVFWVGFVLFVVGLCGELCYCVWCLLCIIGYVVIGLIVGLFGFGVIDVSIDEILWLLMDVVFGLLLFEFGSCFDLCWIWCNLWFVVLSFVEVMLIFVFVLFVMFVFGVLGMVVLVLLVIVIVMLLLMVI